MEFSDRRLEEPEYKEARRVFEEILNRRLELILTKENVREREANALSVPVFWDAILQKYVTFRLAVYHRGGVLMQVNYFDSESGRWSDEWETVFISVKGNKQGSFDGVFGIARRFLKTCEMSARQEGDPANTEE